MWSNYGNDFIRSALLNVRTKDCASVLAATLAAIRMRKDAARVVIFRYGYAENRAYRSVGRPCWRLLSLLPANLLPISVIYINGGRQEDTILSGIMSLASSNIAVAAVVFIASILVPFTKVIVMFTLLLSIHFKCQQGLRTRICCCVW